MNDVFEALFSILVGLPFVGMVVVLGGWPVGKILEDQSVSGWSKYMHILVLGAVAYTIYKAGSQASLTH